MNMHIYTYTGRIHIDATITTTRQWRRQVTQSFRKICTSHFIKKGPKRVTQGFIVRGGWRLNRLQHTDLPSPSRHSCVSFSFCWTAQPGPWGPSLSGTCSHPSIFSPTGLQTNWGSRGPLLPGGGFLYHILSLTHLTSNSLTSCLHRVI